MFGSDYSKEIEQYSSYPLLIFGTSGISKEVYSVVREINSYHGREVFDFLGYICEKKDDIGKSITGGKFVCSDENLCEYIKQFDSVGLIVPLGTPKIKRKIVEMAHKYENVTFPNIISPSAKLMIEEKVNFGIGNIVCSGVVMTTDINIGNFNLFNLNSTVGHDVVIGDYCVINPLTAISGFTQVEDDVLIGAGVSIKEHTHVSGNSILGMGAIVCKDVQEESIMISDAAHILQRK